MNESEFINGIRELAGNKGEDRRRDALTDNLIEEVLRLYAIPSLFKKLTQWGKGGLQFIGHTKFQRMLRNACDGVSVSDNEIKEVRYESMRLKMELLANALHKMLVKDGVFAKDASQAEGPELIMAADDYTAHFPYAEEGSWGQALREMAAGDTKITEPPCRWCKCFCPTPEYSATNEGRVLTGYRICWGATNHTDFSCFRPLDIEEG